MFSRLFLVGKKREKDEIKYLNSWFLRWFANIGLNSQIKVTVCCDFLVVWWERSNVFDLGWSSSLSLECNSVAQFRCDLHGTYPEQTLIWNSELELDSSLLWSPRWGWGSGSMGRAGLARGSGSIGRAGLVVGLGLVGGSGSSGLVGTSGLDRGSGSIGGLG